MKKNIKINEKQRNILLIVICYLLIFNRALIKNVIGTFYKCVNKIRKKEINYNEKIEKTLEKYSNEASYIKNHKTEVLIGTLITFIQRTLMFSITYVVYKGLGFSGISYFELLLLQIFTQIAIEGLPLPGGTGALEAITNKLYLTIFGNLAVVGTVLTRTLSFYLPLIIILIIIIAETKINYSKKKESII